MFWPVTFLKYSRIDHVTTSPQGWGVYTSIFKEILLKKGFFFSLFDSFHEFYFYLFFYLFISLIYFYLCLFTVICSSPFITMLNFFLLMFYFFFNLFIFIDFSSFSFWPLTCSLALAVFQKNLVVLSPDPWLLLTNYLSFHVDVSDNRNSISCFRIFVS